VAERPRPRLNRAGVAALLIKAAAARLGALAHCAWTRWHACLAALLLVLLPAVALAAPGSLLLDDRLGQIDAWPAVTVLEDPGGKLSVDAVLAASRGFAAPRSTYATLGMQQGHGGEAVQMVRHGGGSVGNAADGAATALPAIPRVAWPQAFARAAELGAAIASLLAGLAQVETPPPLLAGARQAPLLGAIAESMDELEYHAALAPLAALAQALDMDLEESA
jgi:hypothetical protein